MSGHVHPDAGRLETPHSASDLVQDEHIVLPELPRHLLSDILRRLSSRERQWALTQNVFPIAWLPQLILHAVIGERTTTESAHVHVVARLPRIVFLDAVRRVLGARLKLEATEGLRRTWPEFSAAQRLNFAQALVLAGFLFSMFAISLVVPGPALTLGIAILFNVFFLLTLSLRLLWLTSRAQRPKKRSRFLRDDQLPVYTVLVPVFRETRVLHQLIGALSALQYPVEKLDIKLVLEETDTVMQRALAKIALPPGFEVIIVPAGKPQTKPRALAYALKFARGELLTIYDAEDIPEPQQLLKAAQKFFEGGPELACLQAELGFYNPNENWLTRGIMAQVPQAIQRFAA